MCTIECHEKFWYTIDTFSFHNINTLLTLIALIFKLSITMNTLCIIAFFTLIRILIKIKSLYTFTISIIIYWYHIFFASYTIYLNVIFIKNTCITLGFANFTLRFIKILIITIITIAILIYISKINIWLATGYASIISSLARFTFKVALFTVFLINF